MTHVGENLLSKLRDGDLALNQEITDALLSMVDAVRTMLDTIKRTGTDGDEEYPEVTAALEGPIVTLPGVRVGNGCIIQREVIPSSAALAHTTRSDWAEHATPFQRSMWPLPWSGSGNTMASFACCATCARVHQHATAAVTCTICTGGA